MGDTATIPTPVFCDFCRAEHARVEASYDAKINGSSSWAFMCDSHFKRYGPSELGTGIGQRLIVVETSK